MNLSGTLSDWTVSDLLNVMKVTGKTASLHIKGERTGTVHFCEGKVVGAVLDGQAVSPRDFESRAVASDTLFVLNALEDGLFEVGPFEGPEADGWDAEDLVADMQQLSDLEADLESADVRDSFVMLRDEIDQPVTVQVEDWWALASLVSVLSFHQLEDVFGRGRAIRLLHALWRLGLIEKVEGPIEDELHPDLEGDRSEPEPIVLETSPPAVDLSRLDEPVEDEPAASTGIEADRSDDAWLDQIASAAAGLPLDAPPEDEDSHLKNRTVLGVSAPASTVLTGSVLDEMRRLRSRSTE